MDEEELTRLLNSMIEEAERSLKEFLREAQDREQELTHWLKEQAESPEIEAFLARLADSDMP